jgi:Uncharacterized protein conserved in bacteria (DUF2066)
MNKALWWTFTRRMGAVGGMILRKLWLVLMATMIMFGVSLSAHAAGPIETNIFAVQGVDVDVTDKDATTAKNLALVQVQMKAIVMLADKLGTPEMSAEIAKLEDKDVLPLLKSLSIEQESTGPGRYIGRFTVRFLPTKIRNLFEKYGVNVVVQEQSKPMLVLPLWKTADGIKLWEDNPWLAAWRNLHAEQSQVPLIVPIGDAEDVGAVNAQDVLDLNPIKLEILRRRYDVRTVLVAVGETAEGNGIHAIMTGESELGTMKFDKVYAADPATLEASAALAASRFHAVMIDKFKSDKDRLAAQAQAAKDQQEANASHSIPVSVPFTSPSEWNGIRSRILATPGVIGVDVSTLAGNGAVVRLMYVGSLEDTLSSMQATGLQMSQIGGTWVIQPAF